MSAPSVVLIGPPGAGKTTLGPILAELVQSGGVAALLDYWRAMRSP